MDKLLADLVARRDALNRAIAELEAVNGPVGNHSAKATQSVTFAKRKPTWTPEAREAARKRMQAYWAAKRKGKGGAKASRPRA